jgi:hypothetical protein
MPPSGLPDSSDLFFVKSDSAVSLRSKKGAWLAYALGYRLAADSLIDSILRGDAPNEVAYPALFCYRQYLEMELKAIAALAILVVAKIEEASGDDAPLSPKTTSETMLKESQHDLVSLLDYSEAIYRKFMPNQSDAFVGLTACVREFSAHDPNSFAFRYPTRKALDSFTPENLEAVDLQHFKNTAGKVTLLLTQIRKLTDAWVRSFDAEDEDNSDWYDEAELKRFGISGSQWIDESPGGED